MIAYRIPLTKITKDGSVKEISAQKGRTCWYYAARMVRAFHERTFSHLKAFESEEQQAERRIEATVSMVRKWETDLENIIRLHPNDRLPENILTALSKPILNYWAGKGIPYDEDKWKKTVDGFYEGESIKDGHENLYQYVHSLFRLLHLDVIRKNKSGRNTDFRRLRAIILVRRWKSFCINTVHS